LKTKKIYLIRHGQTDYNNRGVVQGSGIDSSLNETGYKQAYAFFDAYQQVPFQKIYTSSLLRTTQTVKPFIDKGIPFEQLPGLNEIHWGTKEGIPFNVEENTYYHKMISGWQQGQVDLAIEGGESPRQVYDRQKPAFDHIMAQTNESLILICMHGRAMRILLCMMLNYQLKNMDMFEHHNVCLYRLSYTGSMFTVDLFDDRSHLNGQLIEG